MHISDEVKQSAIGRASWLGPYKILRKENMDGIKFFLDVPESDPRAAEPWVLFRASGTELLLRVYSEAASPQLVADILAAAETFVQCP